MEGNVRRYAAYQAAFNFLLWLPVFVLYLSESLPLGQVLTLEAVYYATVVALEVPSGYLSDRLGRRPTLVAASLAWVAAGLVFASSSTWAGFAVAQVLLAAGMAFNSGTDSSLLYDSLDALGRADEFARREGRAQAWARASLAIAALLGGVIGAWNLRGVYIGSAAAAAVAAGVALSFTEPSRHQAAFALAPQLRATLFRLGDRWLAWTFVFAVAITVFDHVPYELAQPYLAAVLDGLGRSELLEPSAGVLTAGAMLLSAGVAAAAPRMLRWGPKRALLVAMATHGVLLGALSLAVHPVVAGLLLLRSVPSAIHGPVLQAIAHPRLPSHLRATYLSVQSLVGRLAFSGSLLVSSAVVGGQPERAAGLMAVARTFAIVLVVAWIALAAWRPGPPPPAPD
jgi:MFS family permease